MLDHFMFEYMFLKLPRFLNMSGSEYGTVVYAGVTKSSEYLRI